MVRNVKASLATQDVSTPVEASVLGKPMERDTIGWVPGYEPEVGQIIFF